MNKNLRKILKLITLAALLLLVAGCKKVPHQETAAAETTVPVQITAETVMETITVTTEETQIVETIPKVTAPEAGSIGYAEYLELAVEEQQAYYENFASADEFFAWMDKTKKEYEEAMKPSEPVGSSDNNQEETGPVEVVEGVYVEEGLEELE